MIASPSLLHRFLPLVATLALAGCLEPLADPADAGPDSFTLFEVAPGADLGQWVPETVDTVSVADAEDVSATDDSVTLADGATGDSALPDDTTTADAADDATGTTLPDAATGVDVSTTCGDGKCVKTDKENCKTCPADCGDCPSICGDSVCGWDETCTECPGDCGPCSAVCELFGSTGCQSTEQCYPDGKANLCSAAGTKTIGDDCLYFNECQKGQLCVGGKCRVICNYTGVDAQWLCEPGVACDKVNVGGKFATGLGVCQ